MTAIRRLRGAFDRAEEAFMATALAFMTLITFAQVVMRYVFGSALIWSLEATTYIFAWLVLIGMSYCVRTQSHIAVDVLANWLTGGLKRLAVLLTLLLGLFYCGLMAYGSGMFVDRLVTLGNYARDIPAPRWLLTGIMPIAFLLLAVRLIQAAWPVLSGRDTGEAGTGGSGTGARTPPR